MDNLTVSQRSICMSNIRSKNTKVEIMFRRFLWKNNLRGYRINTNISGRPDVYFSKKNLAIFIDGCFWHKCPKCFVKPKSSNDYWDKKIENNFERDLRVNKELKQKKIKVFRLWEHEIKKDINSSYYKLKSLYDKI